MALDNVGIRLVLEGQEGFISGLRAANLEVAKFGQNRAVTSFLLNTSQGLSSLSENLIRTGTAATIGLTLPLVGAFSKIISEGNKFESALAGVLKTTEELTTFSSTIDDPGIRAFGQELRNLSKEIPITAIELANIAEVAGQLGVDGSEDLREFTEVVAKLGVTTNVSSEQAATALARIGNVLQIQPEGFTEFVKRAGSAVVALGNQLPVTESEILEFAKQFSATAGVFGFAKQSVFSIAAAFKAVGANTEAATTALSLTFQQFQSLINSGGAGANYLQNLLDYDSLAILEQKFVNEPEDVLQRFLIALKESENDAAIILDNLSLDQQRTFRELAKAAGGADLLAEAFSIAGKEFALTGDELDTASALVEEAGKRFQTVESKIQILINKVSDFAVRVRDLLKPNILAVLETLDDFVERIAGLSDQAILTALKIGSMAAAFGVLTVGTGVFIGIISSAIGVLGQFTGLIGTFVRGGFVKVFISLFTGMVLPILTLTTIVKGLASAFNSNLAETGKSVTDFATTIFENFNQIVTKTRELLANPINLEFKLDGINNLAGGILSDRMLGIIQTVIEGFNRLKPIVESIFNSILTVVTAFTSTLTTRFKQLFGFSDFGLSDYVNLFIDKVEELDKFLDKHLASIVTFVENLATNIVKAVGKVIEVFVLIQDGITTAFGSLGDYKDDAILLIGGGLLLGKLGLFGELKTVLSTIVGLFGTLSSFSFGAVSGLVGVFAGLVSKKRDLGTTAETLGDFRQRLSEVSDAVVQFRVDNFTRNVGNISATSDILAVDRFIGRNSIADPANIGFLEKQLIKLKTVLRIQPEPFTGSPINFSALINKKDAIDDLNFLERQIVKLQSISKQSKNIDLSIPLNNLEAPKAFIFTKFFKGVEAQIHQLDGDLDQAGAVLKQNFLNRFTNLFASLRAVAPPTPVAPVGVSSFINFEDLAGVANKLDLSLEELSRLDYGAFQRLIKEKVSENAIKSAIELDNLIKFKSLYPEARATEALEEAAAFYTTRNRSLENLAASVDYSGVFAAEQAAIANARKGSRGSLFRFRDPNGEVTAFGNRMKGAGERLKGIFKGFASALSTAILIVPKTILGGFGAITAAIKGLSFGGIIASLSSAFASVSLTLTGIAASLGAQILTILTFFTNPLGLITLAAGLGLAALLSTESDKIGAGIQSLFKGDFQAAGRNFSEALNGLKETISNAFQTLTSFLRAVFKPIGDAFARTAEPLGESLSGLKTAFSGLTDALQPILVVLGSVIGAISATLIATFNGILLGLISTIPAIIDVISGLITSLSGFFNIISGIITLDGERIRTGFSSIFSGLGDSLGGVFDGLMNLVVGFFTGFGATIGGIIESLVGEETFGKITEKFNAFKEIFSSLFDEIVPALQASFETIKSSFAEFAPVFAGLGDLFGEVFAIIKPILTGIAGLLLGAFGAGALVIIGAFVASLSASIETVAVVLQKLSIVFSGVLSVVSGVMQVLVGVVQGAFALITIPVRAFLSLFGVEFPNTTSTALENAKQLIINGFDSIFTGVINIVAGLLSAIVELIGGGLSRFSRALLTVFSGMFKAVEDLLPENAQRIGNNVIEFIKNAIVSVGEDIPNAIRGIFLRAIDAIKNFNQPFTNETRGLAQDAVQGFSVGGQDFAPVATQLGEDTVSGYRVGSAKLVPMASMRAVDGYKAIEDTATEYETAGKIIGGAVSEGFGSTTRSYFEGVTNAQIDAASAASSEANRFYIVGQQNGEQLLKGATKYLEINGHEVVTEGLLIASRLQAEFDANPLNLDIVIGVGVTGNNGANAPLVSIRDFSNSAFEPGLLDAFRKDTEEEIEEVFAPSFSNSFSEGFRDLGSGIGIEEGISSYTNELIRTTGTVLLPAAEEAGEEGGTSFGTGFGDGLGEAEKEIETKLGSITQAMLNFGSNLISVMSGFQSRFEQKVLEPLQKNIDETEESVGKLAKSIKKDLGDAAKFEGENLFIDELKDITKNLQGFEGEVNANEIKEVRDQFLELKAAIDAADFDTTVIKNLFQEAVDEPDLKRKKDLIAGLKKELSELSKLDTSQLNAKIKELRNEKTDLLKGDEDEAELARIALIEQEIRLIESLKTAGKDQVAAILNEISDVQLELTKIKDTTTVLAEQSATDFARIFGQLKQAIGGINPEIDGLLDRIELETDTKVRANLLGELKSELDEIAKIDLNLNSLEDFNKFVKGINTGDIVQVRSFLAELADLGQEDLTAFISQNKEFFDSISGNNAFSFLLEDVLALLGQQGQLNGLNDQYEKQQQRLLEIEQKRADLDFLKSQFDLLKLIAENGLDASEILGNIELGVDADPAKLLDATNEALGEVVDITSQQLKEIGDKGLENLEQFIEIGDQIGGGIEEGIRQSFVGINGAATDTVSGIIQLFRDGLLISSPSGVMRDLIGVNIILGIIEGLAITLTQLSAKLASVNTIIITSFTDLVTKIHLIFDVFSTDLLTQFSTLFAKLVKSTTELGVALLKVIVTNIKDISDTYKKDSTIQKEFVILLQKVLSDGTGLQKGYVTLGQFLADGVKQGIQNKVGEIAAEAINLMRVALAAAKAEAGIESPSKVWREVIGENLGQGIIDGFDTKQPGILNAATNLVGGAADAATDELIDTLSDRRRSVEDITKDFYGGIGEAASEQVEQDLQNIQDMLASQSLVFKIISDDVEATTFFEGLQEILSMGDNFASLSSNFGAIIQKNTIDPITEALETLEEKLPETTSKLRAFALLPSSFDSFNKKGQFDSYQDFIKYVAGLEGDELNEFLADNGSAFLDINKGSEFAQFIGQYQEINDLTAKQKEEQEKLLKIEEQRANLAFLKDQLDLIKLVRESGLNVDDFLGGIQLGLDADPAALLEATIAANEQIIDNLGQTLSDGQGFYQNFGDFGLNMAFGVKEGILEGKDIIAQALAEVILYALDSAKDDLQIRSPSKVTRDTIGLPVVMGIVEGLKKGLPLVKDQFTELINFPSPAAINDEFNRKLERKDLNKAAPFVSNVTIDNRIDAKLSPNYTNTQSPSTISQDFFSAIHLLRA